jgi:hypothetical protein
MKKVAFILFTLFSLTVFSQGSSMFSTTTENALDFDGSNDYVNLGTSISFPNTTAFTIETWVFRKVGGSGIVDSKLNGGVDGQYDFMVNTYGTEPFSREVAPCWQTATTEIGFKGNWNASSIGTVTNNNLSI